MCAQWIDLAEMRRIFADADDRVRDAQQDIADCPEIEDTLP
jgi:hypothetical protein